METNGLDKLVAIWMRDGFSEKRIARLTAHHLRYDNDEDEGDPPEQYNEAEPNEPAEAAINPEVQAAIAAGMQIVSAGAKIPH
jgi:hypothetical protein